MATKNVKLKDGNNYILPQTEGTNILSTDVTANKALISDGSGSASWQQVSYNNLSDRPTIPTISVSQSGTSTTEVNYITINGTESKLAGGSKVTFVDWS